MDQKLKSDWIAALRSGRYAQTKGALRDAKGYCCLGVLAEVAGMKISKDGCGIVVGGRNRDYEPLSDILDDLSEFWQRNDGSFNFRQHTFPEIADYIEKNVEVDHD